MKTTNLFAILLASRALLSAVKRGFALLTRHAGILFALCGGSTLLAQPAVDWAALGANATTIINTGQTFVDIGTTLGRPDLAGVDLTVSYSGSGLSGEKVRINSSLVDDDQWNLFNGTLSFSFSSPVVIRFEGGGSILASEVDTFGPAAIGSLVSTHPEPGLTVTDDSVGNLTANSTLTSTLRWVSVAGSNFSHSVANRNQGARLFILVPEPTTPLLAVIGLTALGAGRHSRPKRRQPRSPSPAKPVTPAG